MTNKNQKDNSEDKIKEEAIYLKKIGDRLKYFRKKAGLILDGIETIDGNDAYVIKDGTSTLYYDVKSGLKVAQAKTTERAGKKATQTTNYSDYKAVKGIKVPYKTVMNVGIEIELVTTDVKINEGVTDADFL